MQKYEFFCRDCGVKVYLDSSRMTPCPAQDCLGRPLELVAVVDWNEAVSGMMGIENWVSNRRVLDRKPKK